MREAEPGGADGGPAAVPDKEPETIRPPLDDLESGPRSLAPVAARPEPASPAASSPRPVPPRPRPDPRAAATDPADIPLEEQTAEMRWPPGSWVRVTNIVRHSTSEPIEGIAVGDVAQVTAALSQTLVLIFPTRDNRREVLHIESIETVEAPPPPLARGRRR
ncbi:MAG TPA: hypothetical protein VNN74_06000 [Candidatus Micrarchaeia archaeon]|nr:hypothetical protein [Candidatus Micrarchaeia archaeon]